MAELKITEFEQVNRAVRADQRLYLDSAGKVVAEGNGDAAELLAAEGDEIPRERALALGLVKPNAEEKKAAEAAEKAAKAGE